MLKNDKNSQISAKTLNKSNVWKLSENDIVTLLENASREIDIDTQLSRLKQTIKVGFALEEPDKDNVMAHKSLIQRGFQVVDVALSSSKILHLALKKRTVNRISDITYQNIRHISAQKLLNLIDQNFGGGWDSLSQSVKDVILSGFLIVSTTMPKSRKLEDSALYVKKVREGFEVLSVDKGSWVELIFAKQKDIVVKDDLDDEEVYRPRRRPSLPNEEPEDENDDAYDEEENEEEDDYSNNTDDDDDYNEEELTAESYRTVVDEDPDDLDVESIDDEEEDY
ncbi:MAG: hypothetical protein HUK06_09120 [Bacteroidaceae bacterium]|nr:hypothetical protein [Bacteroidaceae bacterium]